VHGQRAGIGRNDDRMTTALPLVGIRPESQSAQVTGRLKNQRPGKVWLDGWQAEAWPIKN
jgi:hypothetical protein